MNFPSSRYENGKWEPNDEDDRNSVQTIGTPLFISYFWLNLQYPRKQIHLDFLVEKPYTFQIQRQYIFLLTRICVFVVPPITICAAISIFSRS